MWRHKKQLHYKTPLNNTKDIMLTSMENLKRKHTI
jgi:hypothetical protein